MPSSLSERKRTLLFSPLASLSSSSPSPRGGNQNAIDSPIANRKIFTANRSVRCAFRNRFRWSHRRHISASSSSLETTTFEEEDGIACARERASLFSLFLRASWGKSLKRVEREKKKTCARFADGITGVIETNLKKKDRKNGNRAKCARARVSFAASMLLVLKTHA